MFNKYNNKNILLMLSIMTLMILNFEMPGFSSDLSDATDLKQRCEKEINGLEICTKNFGDNADMEQFKQGEQFIKLGRVKFIQSKYTEAIDVYNQYLKLQFSLYEVLAKKYIERTEKLNDAVSADLVDFINDQKVVQYLQLATQNLKDAKAGMSAKNYKTIIDVCRNAKKYALGAYKLAGKPVPEDYKKDAADTEGKILTQ